MDSGMRHQGTGFVPEDELAHLGVDPVISTELTQKEAAFVTPIPLTIPDLLVIFRFAPPLLQAEAAAGPPPCGI